MIRFVMWLFRREINKKGILYDFFHNELIKTQSNIFDSYMKPGAKRIFTIGDIRTITKITADNYLNNIMRDDNAKK